MPLLDNFQSIKCTYQLNYSVFSTFSMYVHVYSKIERNENMNYRIKKVLF